MKISIASGAFGFIKPIADLERVVEINAIRDKNDKPHNKVIYYNPRYYKPALVKNIYKLFQMLFKTNSKTDLVIGIYEIPHGLIAYIVGKIRRIPIVICMIGNPGYTKKRKGLWKLVLYYMLKRVKVVTVTGSKSKKILVENRVNREKIYSLPNSVNIDFFIQNNEKKIYDIISLGRLSSEKELGNLLEIVTLLRRSIPTIKVGIAGKGPEFEILKGKIIKADLSLNVKLLGYVDNIVEFYNSGKVFVITSSTEGLPRTVIEAMACGIPCVASNVGDMEDVIDNDINGYLIQNYSHLDEFAEKIKSLLNNNDIYDKMSNNAVTKIRDKYSYNAATKVWKEIISKIGE